MEGKSARLIAPVSELDLSMQRLLPCACYGPSAVFIHPTRAIHKAVFEQRTFLKNPERKGNIPIHAIGLSLYESLPGMTAEQIGAEVIRTQWL